MVCSMNAADQQNGKLVTTCNHIRLFFPRDAPYESPNSEFGADGLFFFLAGGFGGYF